MIQDRDPTKQPDARLRRPDARLRRKEFLAFLLLAFGIWPIIAIGVVGGYGFLVWMWQIVFGPPGPPAGGIF